MLNLLDKVNIRLSDSFQFLKKADMKFDVVFADPPYNKYKFNDLKDFVEPILSKDGVFCYESNKNEIEKKMNMKIKIYGSTQVIFWRKK